MAKIVFDTLCKILCSFKTEVALQLNVTEPYNLFRTKCSVQCNLVCKTKLALKHKICPVQFALLSKLVFALLVRGYPALYSIKSCVQGTLICIIYSAL